MFSTLTTTTRGRVPKRYTCVSNGASAMSAHQEAQVLARPHSRPQDDAPRHLVDVAQLAHQEVPGLQALELR